jgi:hypothetical protein
MVRSDPDQHLGFTAGQLLLLGVAAIVLLVFAWTYLN